jgi:diguanylate cyclase (GGDEF)-like protein
VEIAGLTGLVSRGVLLAAVGAASWAAGRRERERAVREATHALKTELEDVRTRAARTEEQMGRLAHRLRAAAAELELIATTDGLTGVATRRRFDDALANEWRRAARAGQPLSLLMADVDHFKAFNDRYGHPAGDTCLRMVAAQLGAAARRPADLAARYGGEEFALLLPGSEPDGAALVAQRVCTEVAALEIPHEASSVGPHVTVSAGLATRWPKPGEDPDAGAASLVEAADQALYRAKAEGRGRVVVAPQPSA